MALFQNSGQTPERRLQEAAKLVSRLVDVSEQMTIRESEFLTQMESATVVSPKQLYWLRDLVEKYNV